MRHLVNTESGFKPILRHCHDFRVIGQGVQLALSQKLCCTGVNTGQGAEIKGEEMDVGQYCQPSQRSPGLL